MSACSGTPTGRRPGGNRLRRVRRHPDVTDGDTPERATRIVSACRVISPSVALGCHDRRGDRPRRTWPGSLCKWAHSVPRGGDVETHRATSIQPQPPARPLTPYPGRRRLLLSRPSAGRAVSPNGGGTPKCDRGAIYASVRDRRSAWPPALERHPAQNGRRPGSQRWPRG